MHGHQKIAPKLAKWAALVMALTASAWADTPHGYYLGADLSYVNEMEDCGVVYRDAGKPADPFVLLQSRGANLVRVRLWNDAKWTRYSNLADVEENHSPSTSGRHASAARLSLLG